MSDESLDLGRWIREYQTTLTSPPYAPEAVLNRQRYLECLETFVRQNGITSLEAFETNHFSGLIDCWVVKFDRSHHRVRPARPGPHYYYELRIAVRGFLRWAQSAGYLPYEPRPPRGFIKCERPFVLPDTRLYLDFCREHKGLAKSSLHIASSFLRRFEFYLAEHGVSRLSELTGEHLDGYLLQLVPDLPVSPEARVRRIRYVQGVVSVLRGFMRYLFSLGRVNRDWSLALRAPRLHRLAATPRALSAGNVLRILESIDRRRPPGKRDFAALLLAATLGLRVGELAVLRLERLDWQEQLVWVEQPKTGNYLSLPLSRPLMEAITDYLTNERPRNSPHREVFLQSVNPWRPITAQGLSVTIRKRMYQAGIRATAHQLRHSFAGELLRTGIAYSTLQELLGHRQITSTQVYTKIDLVQLRDVAINNAEDY
ncbi:MAG: tyrosine-type recombinase/integrase [Acidobacteriota bacterium]